VSDDVDYYATADDEWEPPVGVYSVLIYNAEAWTKDVRKFAKAYLRVTKGTHEGREFEHFMGFNSKAAANINKGALSMYGFDVAAHPTFEDVVAGITEIIGTKAEVAVKHKDGYVNVDVLRSFTEEESDLGANQASMFETTPSGGRNAIKTDDDDVPY
jgi:hypothetical protein